MPDQSFTTVSHESVSTGRYLTRLWSFNALVLSLAKRDVKVKYAQTLLGLLWSVIQPLTGLLIFTLFFDRIIQVQVPGNYYPVFALSGMICWYFFSYIVQSAGTSLSQSQELIKKVYFPKLVLPLSKVLVGFTEFLVSIVLLLVLMVMSGTNPTFKIFAIPVIILFNVIVALSIAIWLSALTVRYRDFHHIIPYLVNFGIWLTPVFYPSTLIPGDLSWLLYLNPMAGVIESFRWAIIPSVDFDPNYIYAPLVSVIILFFGIRYFIRTENYIADFV